MAKYRRDPDFDDPEDYIDDVDDNILIPDLLEKKPKESDEISGAIVVDGIPIVGSDRIEKLKSAIRKIYSKFGVVINEHYPVTNEGKTKGYCFLELENHERAVQAVETTNKHKLDRNHTFIVSLFSDFEKYEKIPDVWEPPVAQPFQYQGSLKSHLLQPDACDQYVLHYKGGQEVAVYQNTVRGTGEPKLLQKRDNWTQSFVKWSPLGSYLATCHNQGIQVWGFEDFRRIMKFGHSGVQFIDFSPCEKYLITSKPVDNQQHIKPLAEQSMIMIWDIITGAKMRSFSMSDYNTYRWPIFKWSTKDKYFAGITKDGALSVFETPDFGMLDKKSIKVIRDEDQEMKVIRDFSWSPTENTLAYWVGEDSAASVPARVVLLEIPSRKEIRGKHLFNVADCKMYWQSNGNYLCVKTERYNKLIVNKQKEDEDVKSRPQYAGLFYDFELFHMREKEIPVDSIEIREEVHAFAWEPAGIKFAIIHGDLQSLNVSFYEMKTGQTPVLRKKYERRSCNMLYWSPQGRHVVLVGLHNQSGLIECIDTTDFTPMISSGEHFSCTDVEWDPTGRYFTTGVSWWKSKVDNAYWIWSYQGKVLKKFQSNGFCQLLWRPRHHSLLSLKDVKEIKKKLKQYSATFDALDREQGTKQSKEILEKRRKLYEEFMEYLQQKKLQSQKFMESDKFRNFRDCPEMEEVEVETLISSEVFVVN